MPRDDVANAFKAVEDAKQGMETAINSAKKYQSENIPEAKAKADKLLQDARGHIRNSGSTRQMDRWRVSRTHTRST